MDELIVSCDQQIRDLSSKNQLTRHDVDQIKSRFLGKKSDLIKAYQTLGKLSPEEKKDAGRRLNDVKSKLSSLIEEAYLAADQAVVDGLLSESVDVTAIGRRKRRGTRHPLTIAYQEIMSIFHSMGFEVASGPEIEDDFHNFEALNFPDDHPARTMHDTFYIEGHDRLLRTHTSTVQIHTLKDKKPPLRMITPGRVYRCDHDPTHTPMFNQLECLVVEPGCNFAQLKWLLISFCEAYLGKRLKYRFRPSFFPFTEPSAELDIWWNDRWLELAGCGMVHPNVLTKAGIDHTKYPGLAFGVGIDRLAMLKYGISDLRLLFDNHLDFLEQF